MTNERGAGTMPGRVVAKGESILSGAQCRALAEISSEWVALLNDDGRVIHANPTFSEQLGLPPHTLEGTNLTDWVHPEDRPTALLKLRECLKEAHTLVTGEFRVGHADGSWRHFECSGYNRLEDPGVAGVVATARDITRSVRAEHALQESEARCHVRTKQQECVAKLGQVALEQHETDALLRRAVEAVAQTLNVELCKVLRVLPGGRELVLEAGVGWQEGLVGNATVGAGLASQAGFTLLSNTPVIVADLATDKRFNGPPLLRDQGVVSGISAIIRGKEAPYGVLGAHSCRARTFTQDDALFVEAVANLLGAAVERRRMEEDLRKEAELCALMANMADGVAIADADGRLSIYGKGGTRLGGMTCDLGVEQWPVAFGLFLPDGVTHFPAEDLPLVRALRGEECRDVEMFVRNEHCPEGAYICATAYPRRVSSAVGGAVVTFRDITERKKVEAALMRSERRFRRLVDANIIGIILTDTRGRVLEANEEFFRMTGYTAEDLQAGEIRWDEMTPVEHSARDLRAIESLRNSGMAPPWEKEYFHKDGHRVPALVGVAMVDEGTEECIGYVLDQSDRRRLQEQLLAAQKMEAIGQLTGGIAHDFNNILSVILPSGNFLLESLDPSDWRREDAVNICQAAERAATLTQQLLAFGRRQVLEPAVLDLNAVINGLERMLRRVIREDIALEIRPGADLGRVRADRGQLEQVLMNLVINARDAMPMGGKVWIDTDNVEVQAGDAGALFPKTPGAYVCMNVGDNGCGMDAQTLQRIFEPFFTTKAPGQGTGLGLATCHGIIKQSGGEISVYSERGHGTVFRIYLPRVDARPSEAQPEAAPRPAIGTETILVIEDDDDVRTMVATVLESRGYRVLAVRGGEEALAKWESAAGCIDLVLSDVVLRGELGPHVVRRIRARKPALRFLFMSGYADHAVLDDGLIAPGLNLLRKPFTIHGLARRVRDVLDA